MADFIWSFHTQSTKHPESGFIAKLGNSYEFASAPSAPDQRTFELSFPTMMIYTSNGDTWPPVFNKTKNVAYNIMALYDHYLEHRTWKTFRYPHPLFGWLNVRYAEPFSLPEGIPGGNGAVRGFTIKLREQP